MIIELLLSPIFLLIKGIINLIPELPQLPNFLSNTIELLKFPLSLFPSDLWKILILNIVAWIAIHNGWAIIEWVYKKIPGVD